VNEGGKILMIDDDEDVLLAAKMLLKKYNYHVIIEKNPNKIPFLLNNDTYDVILLDMNFSFAIRERWRDVRAVCLRLLTVIHGKRRSCCR